jgi:hypothetical protein
MYTHTQAHLSNVGMGRSTPPAVSKCQVNDIGEGLSGAWEPSPRREQGTGTQQEPHTWGTSQRNVVSRLLGLISPLKGWNGEGMRSEMEGEGKEETFGSWTWPRRRESFHSALPAVQADLEIVSFHCNKSVPVWMTDGHLYPHGLCMLPPYPPIRHQS